MGWPSSFACGARPWPTHMAELPCWGARGSARQRRFALLRAFPWFSGLFSKHRTRMNVILEPLRRSLRYGRNGPCFVGFRGRLTLQTPRHVEGRRTFVLSGTPKSVLWLVSLHDALPICSFACGARPWPTHMAELPCWGARGSARQRRFALLRAFPWFSGLFSKHRTRMNVILEPLRRSPRYGRNGPGFVGFRGRLTLQTPRNVEGRRRNELSGTQKGVPWLVGSSAMGWPSSFACGARPWPTHMAELPCWGARGSARQRRFVLLSTFPSFSATISKHPLRLHDTLPILRRSPRYGRNGPCFVGFRGRLTLQTPRNVEERRRNELSGTQKG